MRLKVVLACAITAAFALGAPGGAAAGHETEWKACGDKKGQGAGWYDVRAQHVSCDDARTVARRWWNNGTPRHVKVDGVTYHCRHKKIGYEVVRVRCNDDGERHVRFKAGS
jgi:hypothetical protein